MSLSPISAPRPTAPHGLCPGFIPARHSDGCRQSSSPSTGSQQPQTVTVQPKGQFDLVKGISVSPARQLWAQQGFLPWNSSTAMAPNPAAVPDPAAASARAGRALLPSRSSRRCRWPWADVPQLFPQHKWERDIIKGLRMHKAGATCWAEHCPVLWAACHEPRGRAAKRDTAPGSAGKGSASQLCHRDGTATAPGASWHQELPQQRETAPPCTAELLLLLAAHMEAASRALRTFPAAGRQPGPAPPGEHPSVTETCPSPSVTPLRRSSAWVAAISRRIIQG